MPPPIPSEEIMKLMRFVAEKSKNAKGPMNIRELGRQFIEETGSSLTVVGLVNRIRAHRDRIPSMDEFDMETKVKMMLAVSARVDDGFLRELRKEAEVEVDDCQRITRYEKKGGGLKLEGTDRRINEFSSSSAKRGSEPKTSTSGGQKRARTARDDSEVYDKELMSDREGSFEGLDITQGNAEVPTRPTEINQNPENILKNGPNIENNGYRFEQQPQIDYEKEEVVQNVSASHTHGISESGVIDREDSILEQKPRILLGNEADGPPEEPSTSVKNLLVLLRGVVMSIESPSLAILLSKIEQKIHKLSSGSDRHIPLETIYLAFDPCLFLLIKNSSMSPEEESSSLQNFLTSLRVSTCHLIHPSMAPFHEKLRSNIDKFNAYDQKIPIKIVHNAIDSVVNFIDS